jgi:hypothetical protein
LLLALASSSAAFAQKKKASTSSSDTDQASGTASTAAASSADNDGSTHSTGKKKKPGSKGDPASTGTGAKGKHGKAGHTAQAGDDAMTGTEPKAEAEPDLWERPPADVEKPPPPPRKVEKKVVGDGRPISMALVLGYGFLTDRKVDRFGADPYGLALGVRGGYSFDFQLYAGVFYSYYLGSTRSGLTSRTALSVTSTANYMQFGVEAGYDIWAGSVIVRPSLQIGAALGFTTKPNTQSPLGSVLFAPGMTVDKTWGIFFLGGEMRLNIVPGDGNSALILALNPGLRFQ